MLAEDFSIGINLGMLAEEAEDQAASYPADCHIEVLARDDIAQRAPYDTEESEVDRVLVIHQESQDLGDAAGAFTGDIVSEIRCYFAAPADSVISLGGEPAAKLTEEMAKQAYGEPINSTSTGDNEVHYTYYFELADQPKQMLELVLSFHNGGYCFALALAMEARLK